jgi:hypothetical protein
MEEKKIATARNWTQIPHSSSPYLYILWPGHRLLTAYKVYTLIPIGLLFCLKKLCYLNLYLLVGRTGGISVILHKPPCLKQAKYSTVKYHFYSFTTTLLHIFFQREDVSYCKWILYVELHTACMHVLWHAEVPVEGNVAYYGNMDHRIFWHICWKLEFGSKQRWPFLENGPANKPIARQWLSERHVTTAMLMFESVEELMWAFFSVRGLPRGYIMRSNFSFNN